jgi:hypothetical protein
MDHQLLLDQLFHRHAWIEAGTGILRHKLHRA